MKLERRDIWVQRALTPCHGCDPRELDFFMWSCGKTWKIDFEGGEDGEVKSIPHHFTLSLFSFTVRCCQTQQPQEVVLRTLA